MRNAILLFALVLICGCDRDPAVSSRLDSVSDIRADETVVFFRSAAWLDEERGEWHLPVHGWIYEPQESVVRKSAFKRVLKKKYGLEVTSDNEDNFSARLNLVIADNERGKRIVVSLADQRYVLPKSAKNGHFEDTLVLSAADVARHARNGFIDYSAVTRDKESRTFRGTIRLVEPAGLSVISDIDDTVKISQVRDRPRLLENTFLKDFAAAPGMAARYRALADAGASFHFVSSSPWQLYEPLRTFMEATGFPWATFSLKAVRFRDETLFDLFKKGTETKPNQIRAILDRYPNRHFVLIGDSGEQDPEVYADLLRERPRQVLAAYIRNVSAETPANDRFSSVFEAIDPARWALFDDPATLSLPGGG